MKSLNNENSLTIIIPTYNNPIALERNIMLLCDYFGELDLRIPIIIADDGSTSENHDAIVDALVKINSQAIEYYYHPNMGLEKNELFLISKVTTRYAMLLGEDDYLSIKFLKKVLLYLQNDNVGAIVSNFFAITDDGAKIKRGCRNRLKKDKVYRNSNYKLIFLAHQMSGLIFRVEGLLDYYQKNVDSNVYPQLSFIAHSIDSGINIHITDSPFACTVLRKKRFNYSYDGLIYDLLKNIIAYAKDKKLRKRMINHFLFKWQGQFCNLASWKHPIKFLKNVENYSLLSKIERAKIRTTFICSYFTIPFRLFYRFIILPLIGLREQKTIKYEDYSFE